MLKRGCENRGKYANGSTCVFRVREALLKKKLTFSKTNHIMDHIFTKLLRVSSFSSHFPGPIFAAPLLSHLKRL